MSEAGLQSQLVEQLQDMLLSSDGLQDFLDRLAQHAAATISPDGGVTCSVLLLLAPRERIVATGPGSGMALQEFHGNFDDGPGPRALLTGDVVLVDDVSTEARWPEPMAAAAAAGIGSILALPLRVGHGGTGAALCCYHGYSHGFPALVRAEAATYARLATNPLRLAERMDRLARRVSDLEAALESRTTINLAAGVVMGQNSCSQLHAMEILRRASNARNVKLRDIARGIVEPLTGSAVTRFDG